MAAHTTPIFEVTSLKKTYKLGRVRVPVLRGVDLTVNEGEWVAILGSSGSGKSTLLHLLGGLDRADRGSEQSIRYKDKPLGKFSGRDIDLHRRSSVGFVFQFYHLLPELSVIDNVLLSAMVSHGRIGYRLKSGEIKPRAKKLLETFGLAERLRHRPAELSGGERQRVAIARALINQPDVLLADEPTGNLDQNTGATILDSIADAKRDANITLVMVTHDARVADRADRVIELTDGVVTERVNEAGTGRPTAESNKTQEPGKESAVGDVQARRT